MVSIQKTAKSELKKFGLLIGAMFLGVFAGVLPLLFNYPAPPWPVWVFAGFTSVALVYPLALRPVYFLWMRLSLVLGYINSRVILGFIFIVLFTPIGFIRRVFFKDSLKRYFDSQLTTYRVINPSDQQPKTHMMHPY